MTGPGPDPAGARDAGTAGAHAGPAAADARRGRRALAGLGWAVVAVAIGLALLWPIALGPWPVPIAGEIPPEGPAHATLLEVMRRFDEAAAAGDVATVRALATERYAAELERLLGGVGRSLDAAALRDSGPRLRGLEELELLRGIAVGDQVGLVYRRVTAATDTGAVAAPAMLGVRLVWDGRGFRVAGRRARALDPGEDAREAAVGLLEAMLDPEGG